MEHKKITEDKQVCTEGLVCEFTFDLQEIENDMALKGWDFLLYRKRLYMMLIDWGKIAMDQISIRQGLDDRYRGRYTSKKSGLDRPTMRQRKGLDPMPDGTYLKKTILNGGLPIPKRKED